MIERRCWPWASTANRCPATTASPPRLVVPGLYGFVSATKWVTELGNVTRFADKEAYWTTRGWSTHGPVRSSCRRVNVPRAGAQVNPNKDGQIVTAGMASTNTSASPRYECASTAETGTPPN